MRALCWEGVNDLRVETVADPIILNAEDAILKVTRSSVCGSDEHIISGYIPTMKAGDIIGHEFMGEIVDTGPGVKKRRKGEKVVVASWHSCGRCWYCQRQLYSQCDNANDKPELGEALHGLSPGGIYGYTHSLGGYAGCHAQYIRVPFADNDCFPVPDGLPDDKALFCSEAWPTGFMGAEFCDLKGGEIVAVWGCGGVGLMAQKSAFMLGAERVIAIDRLPERLRMARENIGSETINYAEQDVLETLKEMTGGRGPDACIEAVGMESHGYSVDYRIDRVKQSLKVGRDSGHSLREAIYACRKGGTVSVLGVFFVMDTFPMGAVVNKALTLKSAQVFSQKYIPRLIDHVAKGDFDPSFMMTHKFSLEDAPKGYELWRMKEDGCVRMAFAPS
jgi:threonine dehydrogenase-like Zn-dependent dehydrogenase